MYSIDFPLFQDVGALGNSYYSYPSYAGLQSLPDKLWAVEGVLFRISMFCRDLPKNTWIVRAGPGGPGRSTAVLPFV